MSDKNRYLAQEAAVIESPLAFTETSGAASVAAAAAGTAANVQLVIDLISLEGADIGVKRGWLDEMSPACRVYLYKILSDLKQTAIV